MASPDPEIKDGFTAWIKTKPTRDFDQFASSPPGADDSFFYIRYPKTDALFAKKQAEQDPTKILSDQTKEFATTAFNVAKDKDWSKHTKPCQDVMHGITQISTKAVHSASLKPKSAGTDDGFKGEGAACGTSVVKMANEMVSSGRSPRGFTVAAPIDDVADEAPNYKLMQRRGSKSLPATPIPSPSSSPTGRRKKYTNRYFTSPFEPTDDGSNRSWLTMALLGFKKDLTTSTSTLAEEDAIETRLQGGTLAESVENLGPAPKGKDPKVNLIDTTQQPKLTKPASSFRPKPSELREMNFWSPTSM